MGRDTRDVTLVSLNVPMNQLFETITHIPKLRHFTDGHAVSSFHQTQTLYQTPTSAPLTTASI